MCAIHVVGIAVQPRSLFVLSWFAERAFIGRLGEVLVWLNKMFKGLHIDFRIWSYRMLKGFVKFENSSIGIL